MGDSQASNFDNAVTYKEGAVIFAQGEPSNFLYLIDSGEVKLVKDDGHRLMLLSVIGEKSFLGELSMFSDELRSASAIAVKDTTVYMIKKSDISKVLKDCSNWVSDIMVTLCDRMRSTIDILSEHRISDETLGLGGELQAEERAVFKKSLDEYKQRRGLS
jgi:CRP-like cAMP-binding protein